LKYNIRNDIFKVRMQIKKYSIEKQNEPIANDIGLDSVVEQDWLLNMAV